MDVGTGVGRRLHAWLHNGWGLEEDDEATEGSTIFDGFRSILSSNVIQYLCYAT
jgi:hypothetical protein